MGDDTDWKQRYIDVAEQQDRESRAQTETQQQLSRLIARLCVATSGLDPALDPHLSRLKDAAKGGDPSVLLNQAGKISDALLHASDHRDSPSSESRPGLLARSR